MADLPSHRVSNSAIAQRGRLASAAVLRPSYPIETERLLIRPFSEEDFEGMLAIHSRPEVARYLYWEPRGPEEVRRALREKSGMSAIEAEGDGLSLAVVRRDSGALVGEVSLIWRSEEHRQGELGFIIHPDHGGHGFATEAAEKMLALGFEDLGLHRIFGNCEARNAPSARLMERLGMRLEAHLIENEFVKGEWQSELDYAILDREWRESRAP
jgi:RimJ/RimL family protein N-acetyltransferase